MVNAHKTYHPGFESQAVAFRCINDAVPVRVSPVLVEAEFSKLAFPMTQASMSCFSGGLWWVWGTAGEKGGQGTRVGETRGCHPPDN